MHSSRLFSPSGVLCTHLLLPAMLGDSTHGGLPTREAHPSLGVQRLYCDSITYTRLISPVAALRLQPFQRLTPGDAWLPPCIALL